jgi:hypothetical protein
MATNLPPKRVKAPRLDFIRLCVFTASVASMAGFDSFDFAGYLTHVGPINKGWQL